MLLYMDFEHHWYHYLFPENIKNNGLKINCIEVLNILSLFTKYQWMEFCEKLSKVFLNHGVVFITVILLKKI